MMWVPVIALEIIALGRLATFGHFLLKCCRVGTGALRASSNWLDRFRRIRNATSKTTVAAMDAGTGPLDPDLHKSVLKQESGRFDASLVAGSVALAAWTQLFAGTSAGMPAEGLKGAPLTLLFAGGLILVVTPILFRAPGTFLTYLGRQAGFFVGFSAFVLSLCSTVLALSIPYSDLIVGVIATVLVIRDVLEVGRHFQYWAGPIVLPEDRVMSNTGT